MLSNRRIFFYKYFLHIPMHYWFHFFSFKFLKTRSKINLSIVGLLSVHISDHGDLIVMAGSTGPSKVQETRRKCPCLEKLLLCTLSA